MAALSCVLCLLAFSSLGCRGKKAPAEAPPEPTPMERLTEGAGWKTVRIAGLGIVPGYPMKVQFNEGGMLTGGDGVNTFVGTFTLPGNNTMKISDVAMTEIAGPPEVIEQEMLFVSTISRVDAFRFKRGRLELLEGKNPIVALRPVEDQ
jgi:heat shock protein HslJ